MSYQNDATPPSSSDVDATEARMRQALGLRRTPAGGGATHPQQQPDQARQRHRFVQDGEVPVVMVSGRRDGDAPGGRLAGIEASLAAERTARATAERARDDALGQLQSLKTKIAHANIAHAEALSVERQRREQAMASLSEARSAQSAAEQALAAMETRLRAALAKLAAIPEPEPAREPAKLPAKSPVKRARIAVAKPEETEEPEPVQWWLPSYRAKKHGG